MCFPRLDPLVRPHDYVRWRAGRSKLDPGVVFSWPLAVSPSGILFSEVGPNPAFVRDSTATYIRDGILRYAAINEPRVEDDGLLIEGAGLNYVQKSTGLGSTTYWNAQAASMKATAEPAPDGIDKFWALIAARPDLGPTQHRFLQQPPYRTFRTGLMTKSWHVKRKDFDWIAITASVANMTTYYGRGRFNMVTGQHSGEAGAVSTEMEYIGDGSWRISMTWNQPRDGDAVNLDRTDLILCDNDGKLDFLGDNVSGTYCWGPQLSVGPRMTSYIPTVTVPVARATEAGALSIQLSAAMQAAMSGQGSFFMEFGTKHPSSEIVFGGLFGHQSGASFLFQQNSGTYQSYDGTSYASRQAAFDAGDTVRVAQAWGGGGRNLSVLGSTQNSVTFDGAFQSLTSPHRFFVGIPTNHGYHLRRAWMRKDKLTAAQLTALTTVPDVLTDGRYPYADNSGLLIEV